MLGDILCGCLIKYNTSVRDCFSMSFVPCIANELNMDLFVFPIHSSHSALHFSIQLLFIQREQISTKADFGTTSKDGCLIFVSMVVKLGEEILGRKAGFRDTLDVLSC
eukprot:512939_1